MDVGTQIAKRRSDLGLTQADLAQAAEITVRTIGSVERNETWPRKKTLGAIEHALGWAPGSLERIREGGAPDLLPATIPEGLFPHSLQDQLGYMQEKQRGSSPKDRDGEYIDTNNGEDLTALRASMRVLDQLPQPVQDLILQQARRDFFAVGSRLTQENDRRLIQYAFELLDKQETDEAAARGKTRPRVVDEEHGNTPGSLPHEQEEPETTTPNVQSLPYVAHDTDTEPEEGDDDYHDGP
ncbi:Putative transcriptional regulator, HTH3-type [Corynebacterium glyciniphilum AJ 3170]|uniref:Putative transcriptional regulator, HTH3-type n=1 Tax=Corynebacterium glyciniphilum AJ 3170 TaxID=1404245 RepID=X5DUD2_9CORY|nr:helix-turn-helix transcriptional regulator [Corynebacterium glyciniphilum]AHW64889.1 Putative transcriptional regulator, HTH3-type [Corynebacterium glyciniphilum AJ 3170]